MWDLVSTFLWWPSCCLYGSSSHQSPLCTCCLVYPHPSHPVLSHSDYGTPLWLFSFLEFIPFAVLLKIPVGSETFSWFLDPDLIFANKICMWIIHNPAFCWLGNGPYLSHMSAKEDGCMFSYWSVSTVKFSICVHFTEQKWDHLTFLSTVAKYLTVRRGTFLSQGFRGRSPQWQRRYDAVEAQSLSSVGHRSRQYRDQETEAVKLYAQRPAP